MNISFRHAIEEDAETLVQVQVAAFHHDATLYPGVSLGGPPGYDIVEACVNQISEMHYYAIQADGKVIGGAGLREMAVGHIHLDVLYIHPDFHNLGIGTQAIEFIERSHPAKKWTLDTPDYAIRNHHFYEKFGYIQVSKRPVEDFFLIAYQKTLI